MSVYLSTCLFCYKCYKINLISWNPHKPPIDFSPISFILIVVYYIKYKIKRKWKLNISFYCNCTVNLHYLFVNFTLLTKKKYILTKHLKTKTILKLFFFWNIIRTFWMKFKIAESINHSWFMYFAHTDKQQ